jgi:hypothetical protein
VSDLRDKPRPPLESDPLDLSNSSVADETVMRRIPEELLAKARGSLPDDDEPLPLSTPQPKVIYDPSRATIPLLLSVPKVAPIPLARPRAATPSPPDVEPARDTASVKSVPVVVRRRAGIGTLNKLLLLVVLGVALAIAARTSGIRSWTDLPWLAKLLSAG